MGPAKWLQRALKQRRYCQSLSPTQLDSFAWFNMTKTQAIFPNSSCHAGPCATLKWVSRPACWTDNDLWHVLKHIHCVLHSTSHAQICAPVSTFPSAWNIQHIHEKDSFPESCLSSGTSAGNHFLFFFLFVLFIYLFFLLNQCHGFL